MSTITSPTPSWGSNPARQKPSFVNAWKIGPRATTVSSIWSKAYRLKRGTGWLIPPGVLHAQGRFVPYEPQWGSDVFGMYQSLVEGREVPWSLLVKDMPEDKHNDLDFIVRSAGLGQERRYAFQKITTIWNRLLLRREKAGQDLWIVYGLVDGKQLFSARELTLQPGAKCTLNDAGASGWITVQGSGRIGKLDLQTPAMNPVRPRDTRRGVHHARSSGIGR